MNRLIVRANATQFLFAAFLYFLISATYGQEVKLPHGGEPINNVDLAGSDIFHFTLDAPAPGMLDLRQDQCSAACWQNKACLAWTYVKPNTIQGPKGNCWLKNSVPAKKTNSCCISGTIGEVNIDRPGGDYTHFDNVMGLEATPQLCQSICLGQAQCKAWTFVRPNTTQGPKGVCWLKGSVPPAVSNNCCISGYFTTQVIK